jgi:GT2 family glycosyltransferase
LDSIFKQQYQDFETIVVDNGSPDGTIDFIKKNHPAVKLIVNKENLGASCARNQGIRAASGEWILTLDCDVVLENGFLKEIMEFAKDRKDLVGIIQPKILTQDAKRIFSCGIGTCGLRRFYDIGYNLTDATRFNVDVSVFGACCAAALYRRKTLEELKDKYGYFDERFFFLFEDADLSWRAQKKGWECLYYPKARCFHVGNSSSTDKLTRRYLSFRNRNLTILKNQNPILTLFMSPLYLLYDLPRFLFLAMKFKCRFPKFYQSQL